MHKGMSILVIVATVMMLAVMMSTCHCDKVSAEGNSFIGDGKSNVAIYHIDRTRIKAVYVTTGNNNHTSITYFVWKPQKMIWKFAGLELYDNTSHTKIEDTFTLNDRIKTGLSIL